MAARGLGQSIPLAENLSVDPGWLVYGFERDGMDYFQVNDLAGRVHIVIGNAAGTFWVLPAGDPSAKVSLPEQRLPVPSKGTRTVIYRAAAFTLVRYASGADTLWAVRTPDRACCRDIGEPQHRIAWAPGARRVPVTSWNRVV